MLGRPRRKGSLKCQAFALLLLAACSARSSLNGNSLDERFLRHATPKQLEDALKRGASAEARTSINGYSSSRQPQPLLYVTEHGRLDLMKVLLKHHADPNASDAGGVVPLMEAVASANYGAVKLLLDHGASPNFKNRFGSSVDYARWYVSHKTAIPARVRKPDSGYLRIIELLEWHGVKPARH